MNMVLPDAALGLWAGYLVQQMGVVGGTLIVELFANNITVDEGTVLTDFTPASFTGYDPVTLDTSHWVTVSTTDHVGYFKFTLPPTFTCTGGSPETVYGWFMYASVGGSQFLAAAQNFDTPRSMSSGASETLDPFQFGITTLS